MYLKSRDTAPKNVELDKLLQNTFNTFAATLCVWRPSPVYPQPEGLPAFGDGLKCRMQNYFSCESCWRMCACMRVRERASE